MSLTDLDPSLPSDVRGLIREARAAELDARRDVARRRYEAALYRLGGTDYADVASALIRWTGRTFLAEGRFEAAMDCFEAALAVAEAADAAHAAAHAVNCMAVVRQDQGHLDEAEELYRWARSRAVQNDQRKLCAMVDQNLGIVHNIRGDYEGALVHYQHAWDGYLELELEEYVGPLLINMGRVHTDLKQWGRAEALLAQAMASCRAAGDQSCRVLVEVNRARLWIARKDYPRARESCDAAYEMAGQIGDSRWLGVIHKQYGIIHRNTEKYLLAHDHLERSQAIAQDRGDTLLSAETDRELAAVHRLQGHSRETLLCLNRAHTAFLDLRARPDVADVEHRLAALEEQFLEIVQEWGASIESKDHYTQGHCERVTGYACALASETGFDPAMLVWFRMGALLHDVGKVAVPMSILTKPGPLDDHEWIVMMSHPNIGVELLDGIEFPWDIRPMVRHHHERWDGSGYPDGLAGESIPLSARILCVADVFDALTTNRSYRDAYSPETAREIMKGDAEHVFDPVLLRQFWRILDDEQAARAPSEQRARPKRPATDWSLAAPSHNSTLVRGVGTAAFLHPR